MRVTWITIAAIAAIITVIGAYPLPASAQESFWNDQYCTTGRGASIPDCGHRTWQECVESARGLGRWCIENPFWHGHVQSRVEPPPRRRMK